MSNDMLVRCVRNRGWDVTPGEYRGLHVTPETIFDVIVDSTYVAHALTVYNGGLCALILDETSRPNWYPIELFAVMDGRMPPDWRFARFADNEYAPDIDAVWGYPELIDNPRHMVDLTEREPDALAVFHDAAQRHVPDR